MKTKAFFILSFLICNLLSAQNIKLNVIPQSFNTATDSLVLAMDISIKIDNMEAKNAVMLIPVLTNQDRKVLLPHIQLNGKQKQRLYLRNQILRKKNDKPQNNIAYLAEGIGENFSRTISYRTSIPTEEWMHDATLTIRRCIVKPDGEHYLKDTLFIAQQSGSAPAYVPIQENATVPISETVVALQPSVSSLTPAAIKLKYKGSFISPETDEIDARNRKELNFNLEEAKMMADINPQMLSLRELYTVALSYADDRAKFYRIINISVKLYPVHPIANLNAASAAIEMGDAKAASKFLPMASHDTLAYKNCRGVYELMTGNTYEGIRMLKAAKTEGSEEASYNLNVFFENNKRP